MQVHGAFCCACAIGPEGLAGLNPTGDPRVCVASRRRKLSRLQRRTRLTSSWAGWTHTPPPRDRTPSSSASADRRCFLVRYFPVCVHYCTPNVMGPGELQVRSAGWRERPARPRAGARGPSEGALLHAQSDSVQPGDWQAGPGASLACKKSPACCLPCAFHGGSAGTFCEWQRASEWRSPSCVAAGAVRGAVAGGVRSLPVNRPGRVRSYDHHSPDDGPGAQQEMSPVARTTLLSHIAAAEVGEDAAEMPTRVCRRFLHSCRT